MVVILVPEPDRSDRVSRAYPPQMTGQLRFGDGSVTV